MLRFFVTDHQKDWDSYLPILLLAYRATPQGSTNISPNHAMLGPEISLPIDVSCGNPQEQPLESSEYVENLNNQIELIHENARKKVEEGMS